jgi:hypothetical protein
MAFRLKFSSRALREISEAQEWYELQSPGLGEKFIAAMELQLKRLEQAPLLYAEVIPMFAALSFRDSLTVCFMQYGAISYLFWLCYMMLVIRDVGPKSANIALNRSAVIIRFCFFSFPCRARLALRWA